ncbi:MAG: hypothetical protein Q8L48_00280 [Archangium sp.]|nr:hypothetical protein [Archangium sp.]
MTPTPPTRGTGCPPAAALEAFAAGEPQPFAAHVGSCAQCGPYVAALRADADAFARARPPELFLKQLERRAAGRPRTPWWRWLGVLAPVAAALVLFFVTRPPPDDGVTFKGPPLRVFLKRGDAEPALLPPDGRVKPGDSLRFGYDAPADGYLAVFELDGTEATTVFWPFAGTAGAPVKQSQGLLPGTVVLDDSPGPEWLVAVWSRAPFDTAPLAQQLKGQSTRPSVELKCAGCVVTTQRLLKP